ncbi:protein BTG1-like [Uranotaenia lowii]|uniref:protein BTG1-like n=1 Tax=Uranotaenia lowii TaxID=190385 RepID=UPI0024798FA4|nr:protein BTG1-like [Uranotaenia lowii]
MRIEVHSAADFLMNLLRVKKANQLSESQLQHFKGSLEQILTRHFQRHWYPDVPTKGSGFRCLRINGKMDPIIEKAGVAVGLNAVILRKMLPMELTIWIDPEEVSYRIGENGTICVLYDQHKSRASPSSDLDSTGSSSCDEFIMERVGRLDLSNSSDSGNSGMVDYVDTNPSNPLVTQSKHNKYNNHHNNHHHAKRQNNSISSSSSGQTSPPLSPPFNGYNNFNNTRYQHNNQHNNYYSPSLHQQQQYFPWDNQFVNNKVRTQC